MDEIEEMHETLMRAWQEQDFDTFNEVSEKFNAKLNELDALLLGAG